MTTKLDIRKSRTNPSDQPKFWEQWATGDWWEYESSDDEIRKLRHRLYKAVKRKNATIETKVSGGVFYFRIQKQPAKHRSSK